MTAQHRFAHVVLVDARVLRPPGERPIPVVMAMRDLTTGAQTIFTDADTPGAWSAYVGDDVLWITNDAEALGAYLRGRDAPCPRHVLDLGVEARAAWNGLAPSAHDDTVVAMLRFGIQRAPLHDPVEICELLTRRHLTASEVRRVAGQAQLRLDIQGELREALRTNGISLPHALLRGRYFMALAEMGRRGLPVDVV
ncbi:MAG: hypothetical protein ACOYOB_19490, partial [Myxococcota bacterium]